MTLYVTTRASGSTTLEGERPTVLPRLLTCLAVAASLGASLVAQKPTGWVELRAHDASVYSRAIGQYDVIWRTGYAEATSCRFKVENALPGYVSGVKCIIVASLDDKYDKSDFLLSSQRINLDGWQDVSVGTDFATLPQNWPGNTAYIIGVIDPDDEKAELNKDDNEVARKVRVHIPPYVYPHTMSVSQTSVRRSATITLSFTVTNLGDYGVNGFYVTAFHATNQVLNQITPENTLKQHYVLPLEKRSSRKLSFDVQIPANQPPGPFYIGVSTRDVKLYQRAHDQAYLPMTLDGRAVIQSHPRAIRVPIGFWDFKNGTNYVMRVVAENAVRYQWRKHGKDLLFQDKPYLIVSTGGHAPEHAGEYDCVVWGPDDVRVYANGAWLSVGPERVGNFRASTSAEGYGSTVCGIGDFDRDGFQDFAVTHPLGANGAGEVTLISGKTHDVLMRQAGPTTGTMLGASLASADFDQDGFQDVMIGAGTYHQGDNRVIYMLSGKSRQLTRNWTASARIGQFMATGDFDGDAIPDVVHNIGSRSIQAVSPTQGLLWRVEVSGRTGNVWGLAVIGDQDGDGMREVLVGMRDYDPNYKKGRFEVRSGRDGALLFAQNGQNGEELGYSVAGIGSSTSGWGFDYAVGSPGFLGGLGKVTVYGGFTNQAVTTSVPSPADRRVGLAIAAVGDQDGDGLADLAVTGEGFVRVLKGTDANARIGSDRTGSATFGQAIAAIDTSGDSKRDLLVAEPSSTGGELWCFDRATVDDPPAFERYGATCKGTGGRVPRIHGSTAPRMSPDHLDGALARAGGGVRIYLTSAAMNSAALLRLGVVRRDLPLDFIGMPGCRYQVDGIWSFVVPTNRDGASSFGPLEVKSDPQLIGLELLWQWLVLDPGANSFGMTTSDAAIMRQGRKL